MKKILCAIVCCLLAVMILWYGKSFDKSEQNIPGVSIDTAMGTIVNQTIYGAGAEAVTEEVLKRITDLEQEKISWRLETAEIYQVNVRAGEQSPVTLSSDVKEMLEACFAVSEQSEGTFDITIGTLARLWDIDTWAGCEEPLEYPLPEQTEIVQCLDSIGYEKVVLQDNSICLPEKMRLDLGAVGKGIALDEIRRYFEETDSVSGAVISVGGSILTYGTKPNGSPWRVGIVNPFDTSGNVGYLELPGEWCVSTSGDYERYVEVDGIRYHHIINPKTGYPADSGIKGVTVLSKNGLLSDALSTACFILGEEKGKEVAEYFQAEVLFVNTEGTISMSDGMEQYFHLSKE